MKKTIKIIAVVLLFALSIWCGIVTVTLIFEAAQYISAISKHESTEVVKSITKGFVTKIMPYCAVFIMLVLNAFFILFDFYFQESILIIKSKIENNKEKAQQRKVSRLKAKIKKIEGDE